MEKQGGSNQFCEIKPIINCDEGHNETMKQENILKYKRFLMRKKI